MSDKREQLLNNSKLAVQKYGMEGITVKNLSDECGVNDSHLYRFFKNKEELLLEAYKRESGVIFRVILSAIDETKGVPLDFRTRVRLHFHRSWSVLLADPARLAFCVYYYHSISFLDASDFHREQLDELYEKLSPYFDSRESCIQAMYTLMTFLYDNAKRYTDREVPCTPQEEEQVFNSYYALLRSYMSDSGTAE